HRCSTSACASAKPPAPRSPYRCCAPPSPATPGWRRSPRPAWRISNDSLAAAPHTALALPPPLAGQGVEGGATRACVAALPPPGALRALSLPRKRGREARNHMKKRPAHISSPAAGHIDRATLRVGDLGERLVASGRDHAGVVKLVPA